MILMRRFLVVEECEIQITCYFAWVSEERRLSRVDTGSVTGSCLVERKLSLV